MIFNPIEGKTNDSFDEPFVHEYSFGEMVQYKVENDTFKEAMLTFKFDDTVELLLLDKNVDRFEFFCKKSVYSLKRRVE